MTSTPVLTQDQLNDYLNSVSEYRTDIEVVAQGAETIHSTFVLLKVVVKFNEEPPGVHELRVINEMEAIAQRFLSEHPDYLSRG